MKQYKLNEIEKTGLASTVVTTALNDCWSYEKGNYLENYKELAKDFGINTESIVRTMQTHTDKVKEVTLKNGGELVVRDETEHGFDGMVTNEKGLLLCVLTADCVPVLILDPVKKAIAAIHSGWKGTAGLISVNAVKLMAEKYGTRPEDLVVAMGPCICGTCYEVSDDLIEPFLKNYTADEVSRIFTKKENGKYLLNLPLAIRLSLIKAGVMDGKISDPEYCTLENEEFPSYRRDKSEGRILTGIMLHQE